jgi:uncharacterized protein (TIGR02118 family)
MAKTPIINIVTTQCQLQDEAKFNKWYNEVHIPMLMKYPGVKTVARYQVINGKPLQFVAIYRFDSLQDYEAFGKSPEFKAAIEEMGQSWPKGIEIIARQQCELIKEW